MQVLKDAVIINLSPSQKRIFRDSNYSAYFEGAVFGENAEGRPRIPINRIEGLVERLHELKLVILTDPNYREGNPTRVIDQIILKVQSAHAAQQRTYGLPTSDLN